MSALLTLLLLVPALSTAQNLPTAAELIDTSIAYHDPQGTWHSGDIQLDVTVTFSEALAESRGTPMAERQLRLAPAHAIYRFVEERGGHQIEYAVSQGVPTVSLDGDPNPTDEERESLGLRDPLMYRDYHEYMYGIPMKLKDPGTILAPKVTPMDFHGQEVWATRITYNEDVGADIWDFFFDPETKALVGCRFYHDEAANDGEYLIFKAEIHDPESGLRLPKERAWYYNTDGKYLATDSVNQIKVTQP